MLLNNYCLYSKITLVYTNYFFNNWVCFIHGTRATLFRRLESKNHRLWRFDGKITVDARFEYLKVVVIGNPPKQIADKYGGELTKLTQVNHFS